MKHLFTLVFALLAGVANTMAQTVTITKTDGSTVTYKASEIKNIQFANEEPQVKPIHSFTGYILVSSPFFYDTYYEDKAKIDVYTQGEETLCKFSDPKWGEGTFIVTLNNGRISGKGKMSVVNPRTGGAAKTYDAIMVGPMAAVNISITGLMGGTTIKWRNGKAPLATTYSGTYAGENTLTVGKMGSFTNKQAYHAIYANNDGTYSITVLGQKFEGTPMGDLTLGAFTINNLAFDEATKTFSRDYSNDNVQIKLKSVQDGKVGLDGTYPLHDATIKATINADGSLTVENNFTPGSMPFPIKGLFKGTVQK